jgi:hypothetical protein
MAVSGHRARSIFDRYDITSDADLDAAAERTACYLRDRTAASTRVTALNTARAARSGGEHGQSGPGSGRAKRRRGRNCLTSWMGRAGIEPATR